MSRPAIFAGVALAMGCAPVPPPADAAEDIPVHGSTGRTCRADAAQALIGRTASSQLGAEAMRLTGAGILRWMRPGDIVTMEFREDRLNLELDGNNRVTAIRCG